MSLEKIKQMAEQIPESPEKQSALQAYSNLKLFEGLAESLQVPMRPTRSTYLYLQLREVWPEDEYEITSAHYTAKGMMAHITDKTDGQKYLMEIYPVEDKENEG